MIAKIWYQQHWLSKLLLPFAWLYGWLSRLMAKKQRQRAWQAPVPVVIIGNLTVGGNGKTPLVIWLVEQLKQRHYRVAVISRGYGGGKQAAPLLVQAGVNAQLAGDEPVLIWQRTQVPVVVGANRRQSIEYLLQHYPIDLIVSDDGLQHHRLARNVEWVVVDGNRGFGNGHYLPAGPLRENIGRLASVDAVIVNGQATDDLLSTLHTYQPSVTMQLVASYAVNLLTGEQRPVERLKQVVAIAGIGNPQRFFDSLSSLATELVNCVAFADHQHYQLAQLQALTCEQQLLLMTEKDAVKCQAFAQQHWWYLPVNAQFSAADQQHLLQSLLADCQLDKVVAH